MTWWGLWIVWVYLFLLAYPPTDLTTHTIDGASNLHLWIPLAASTALISLMGSVFAFGMASTFKYVADGFSVNMGVVTGIIGLVSGLGGFLLPIILGVLLDVFRVRSSCFVFLYGVVWASLILLYLSKVRRAPLTEHARQGAVQ